MWEWVGFIQETHVARTELIEDQEQIAERMCDSDEEVVAEADLFQQQKNDDEECDSNFIY